MRMAGPSPLEPDSLNTWNRCQDRRYAPRQVVGQFRTRTSALDHHVQIPARLRTICPPHLHGGVFGALRQLEADLAQTRGQLGKRIRAVLVLSRNTVTLLVPGVVVD